MLNELTFQDLLLAGSNASKSSKSKFFYKPISFECHYWMFLIQDLIFKECLKSG